MEASGGRRSVPGFELLCLSRGEERHLREEIDGVEGVTVNFVCSRLGRLLNAPPSLEMD